MDELLLCQVCTCDHCSELAESYITRKVIESAIGVYPQTLGADNGSHALDRLGDFLGRFDPVVLDIYCTDP